MTINRKQLHERLWAAAEQLRANSSLKLNEMSEPILGLIFLKFADVKFRKAKEEIEKKRAKAIGRQAPITPDHFKQGGVPYIPEKASYSYLMDLSEDKSIGKFDFVLANPPFNVKGKDKNKQIVIDPARLQGDRRFNYGLPLTGKGEISNANYLWMQMFASALNDKGRAGFVMANSASDAGNKEKEIRKKMVDAGMVDVIVSVGTNMFMNATLSCTLWFFDKGKRGTDRQNKILFINAQDIFTTVDRAHSEWSLEQIQVIASIVRRYRSENGEEKYEDIKGRCKVATLEETRANDYSLNPGRYVEIVEKKMSDVDFDARMKELMVEFTTLTSEAHKLEKKIQEDWKKIL